MRQSFSRVIAVARDVMAIYYGHAYDVPAKKIE